MTRPSKLVEPKGKGLASSQYKICVQITQSNKRYIDLYCLILFCSYYHCQILI